MSFIMSVNIFKSKIQLKNILVLNHCVQNNPHQVYKVQPF